ncbi:putative low complexity protein with signal peptide [Cryptosporidium felis]|nr:putative low complexity protein with signal peptide [Cryptosporidium felis]
MSLNSVEYFADVKPIPLNSPGKEGILEFSDTQPRLRSSSGGLVSEYRTGTIAIWNSGFDLNVLSSIDQPKDGGSVTDFVSSFDEIFLNVNRISKSAISLNDKKLPAVLIFKNGSANRAFDDEEYRQKYCERACQRPVSNLNKYSYSKTEFVELSYRANIFNQYPARDSTFYPDLESSIKSNSGKGKCSELASSMRGVETAWHLIFEDIRKEKTERLIKEKFLQMYPILTRSVSAPVSVELTESSKHSFHETAYPRIKAFEKLMKKNHATNFVRIPESSPATLENQISPLFQFRAKLSLNGSTWKVDEIFTGSETLSSDFSNEFLNLLLTKSEVDRLIAFQKDAVETWANQFWDSGHSETHVVLPAPLESLEEISRKDTKLGELEKWIQSKERQVRLMSGDTPVSLLQFGAGTTHFHVTGSGSFEGDDRTVQDAPPEGDGSDAEELDVPSPRERVEELHIVYYGILTLNCFSYQLGEDGDYSHSNTVAFSIFPDVLLRRDGDNSFRKIRIPKDEKKWMVVENVFDSENSIVNLIRSSSYSFVLQLARHNPHLYLVLFRDLKHVFGFNNPRIFGMNTCKVPEAKHHVELVSENENTLQKSIIKVFSADPFNNKSSHKIRFTDPEHFNFLSRTMSKCLGVLPPTARVRVNDHFQNRRSVVSDYVCAIDEFGENYLLQLYSKYNIN